MHRKVISRPNLLHGKAHIVGTSITVASILSKLAKGQTVQQISRLYPQLSEEDVKNAVKFAADLLDQAISQEESE